MIKLVTKWTKLQDKSNERLEICKACEEYDSDTSRCKKCGCFMKAKTMWPSSKCPLDKWSSFEEEKT
jgi:hypothetical protein